MGPVIQHGFYLSSTIKPQDLYHISLSQFKKKKASPQIMTSDSIRT